MVSSKAKPIRKKLLEDLVVTHFMKQRDYPNWFRGLSFCQMTAADSLLNNIRDDSEQNTTHRVRDALQRLGIHPLVRPLKIKLAMRLSRGNDIAFLWFLMELFYRKLHRTDEYSLNEQIVMSAISHLDAIPTLRELDRLLPRQPDRPKNILRPRKISKRKSRCLLPYFKKQVRPITYGKKLTLREANNGVNFEYENYRNPNYIVPNENSRWYANYEPHDGKRIAKALVDDRVNAMFSKKHEEVPSKSLCYHHVYAEGVKAYVSRELAVTKRDVCQRCLDVERGAREKAYKRNTADLKRRIEVVKEELQRKTKPLSATVNTCHTHCIPKNGNGKVSFELIREQSTKSLHSSLAEEDVNLDFGHANQHRSQHIFFQAPTHHTPYKFNYAEIFDLVARDVIKDAAHFSLGGSARDRSIDHVDRVQDVCKELWTASVNEHFRKSREELKEGKHVEKVTYYDPNDQDLMTKMLQDALKEIKKNKKFVLASFPDAHKTPFLKEFIKKRYGFVYTRNAKRISFNQSKEVFHVLKRTEIRAKIPTNGEVSANRVVSYTCKDYIQKKTHFLKERYHHKFKLSLMEHARNFWGAVRPYQCSNGPPRNEFFAYLPSRENDIHMFRPWKVNEYIRAKEEWDKRQRAKRTKLF